MKNVKRALALVLVLALALSLGVIGVGAVNYSDVPGTYSYSAEVQFLSELEIITGYPDGTFQPEGVITRAEAAAVIFRMLAGKASASENYQGGTIFSDVAAEHWSSGYINFCTEMGIINGYPDGTFLPDKTINYGEYVTMLARALGLDIGKDLSYPFGYIAEATIENVNYGVDLSAAADCPRGAVAKLTYNAILDATYRRLANNIYVTEKPTIAKDVLKLELQEGTVISVGLYDWDGNNPVGEGKIRILTKDSWGEWYANNFKYEASTALLGKNVKIWFKPDSVTASGDKVYAVVEKPSSVVTLPHITLKGAVAGSPTELTYAINDVDRKLKLSDDCVFVENNEYLGYVDGYYENGDYYGYSYDARDFYPAGAVSDGGVRAWLPISYTFIDNDQDGKYDFATREIWGMGEVVNLTSSKIQIDGEASIDRKDDNSNAFAWNDALEDVEMEDWVLYYADGAVTSGTTKLADLIAGPDFKTNLYDDTRNAKFEKLELQTANLENIVDNDKFIFDGVTYRALSGSLDNPDLNADSYVGDEYEFYATQKFGGLIAYSELITKSTGKYLVITATDDDENLAGNFDIAVIDEKGNEEVYTVKANDSRNLNIYTNGVKSVKALTLANVAGFLEPEDVEIEGFELVDNALCEYSLNSKGQITSLNVYRGNFVGDTINGLSGYKNTTKLLRTSGASYVINSDTVVFVQMANGEYKRYIGGFPKLYVDNDENAATATVIGADFKTTSGARELKALFVTSDAVNVTGVSAKNNVTGYLRSMTRFGNNTDGWGYEYTLAYDGDVSAKFRTATVANIEDLTDLEADEGIVLPLDFANQANVVVFDIQADGTIANMDLKNGAQIDSDTLRDAASEGKYYGTFMVSNVNTRSGLVTLIPMIDEDLSSVTAGAKAINANDAIDTANDNIANEITYACADDVVVYVFDINSTNHAKVEIESLGSLTRPTKQGGDITEGYLMSFAFDTDDQVITAIFFNKRVVKELYS